MLPTQLTLSPTRYSAWLEVYNNIDEAFLGVKGEPEQLLALALDQLIFSRSFATPVTTAAGMRRVLSIYGQNASARLAKHGLQAKVLTAFAGTSPFSGQKQSYPSVCVPLPAPTADPLLLTRAAHALLPNIREGMKYAKVGLKLTDLRPTGYWTGP